MPNKPEPLSEVALYYPGHLWRNERWIKTLILFFDGIALLVPEYKLEEPTAMDPELAGGLRDRGLLHYMVADQVVDKKATLALAQGITNLIKAGVFDTLVKEGTEFHAI